MKKKILLWILAAAILIVATGIIVDARLVQGLMLKKISDIEYKATFPNLSDKEAYSVLYFPKERLDPYFGKAFYEFGYGIALVREDLPEDVQKFVLMHELYHLQDRKHKNVLSRETHATLAGIPYSPVGFLKTVFMSLTSVERLGFYIKLVSNNLSF